MPWLSMWRTSGRSSFRACWPPRPVLLHRLQRLPFICHPGIREIPERFRRRPSPLLSEIHFRAPWRRHRRLPVRPQDRAAEVPRVAEGAEAEGADGESVPRPVIGHKWYGKGIGKEYTGATESILTTGAERCSRVYFSP